MCRGVSVFKTIGIFAHVDSGKTSLAEQILYETKTIRQKGRVDHQTAFFRIETAKP